MDKDYEILSVQDDPSAAVSSLLKQYYLSRGFAPKRIFLPFVIEDAELFSELLLQEFGRKTAITVPQRGDNARLVEMAVKNAHEEAERISSKEEKLTGTLNQLSKLLGITRLDRIESYDVSNISGTDIVSGMVVYEKGKPAKKEYKKFKIQGLNDQDDYAAMYQTVYRRFARFKDGDPAFAKMPDVLLIDGGVEHAKKAEDALECLEISVPVFGMVKDDRHRTRSLVTSKGYEIAIDASPVVFGFIGSIQEETHRYAISFHRSLRSKRLQYSELDSIAGIGPKRKQDLLKQFKSIKVISEATVPELERILTKPAAIAVYKHFHDEGETGK